MTELVELCVLCTGNWLTMESSASSSSADGAVRHCVTSNGLTTSSMCPLGDATVDGLQTEVLALRKELLKKQDLMDKLQDRERQLRERSATLHTLPIIVSS